MGAWNVGLFGNDLAMDIRDDYREFSHFFEDEEELKKCILDRHKESLALDDECPIVYYALAYCQWKNGRLDDDIKEKAIYYIDHPDEDGNLNLWKENALTEQDPKYKKEYEQSYREKIKGLQNLKAMLESPMPPKKEKKIRTGMPPLFELGDIVRVSLTKKDYRRFVRNVGQDFSESSLEKIEALFDDKHYYMIKVGEKKCSISALFYADGEDDHGKYPKIKANESQTHCYEFFCIFEWVGKEELTLEQIARLPICDIPAFEDNGDIHKRDPNRRELFSSDPRKVFCFSNYELHNPDYDYYEKCLKSSQMQKVYNDVSLIPQISTNNAGSAMLWHHVVWFALHKGF